jgi:hypothetical protein
MWTASIKILFNQTNRDLNNLKNKYQTLSDQLKNPKRENNLVNQ